MAGVHHSLNGTQSEVGLCLESSVGQGRQDKVSNGPAEAEGDSGDSLFITQKTFTLPEAGRSGRRPHYSRRSKPVSPRELEGSEDSSSSAICDEELKTHKWRRRKKYSLPNYSFPFLQERKRQSGPLHDQNKSLHNYTIGGFFKCLRELRQSYRRGQNLESSLPTVDMDGEDIPPLSEEDGERSEDEDIKVVERKHLVASSRTKSEQTWCNQLKKQRRRKNATQKGRRASKPVTEQADPRQRSQCLLHRPPERTAVTKVKKKKRRKEESGGLRAAASVNMQAKETPSLSEGCRAAQTSNVLEVNGKLGMKDSSGNVNTLRQEEGGIPHSTKKNKSRAESVGQEVDVGVEDCVVSVSCNGEDCGKKKKKKNRKRSGEDVEQLQSGAVAEPLNDADIQKKKKRKRSGEDVEQLQSGAVAEPLNDADIQKKKKRKRSGEDVEQLQSGAVAEPLNDADIQKKKKRKRSGEDVEQLQSGAVAEPLNDADIQKKKKRKRSGEDVEQLQSGAVAEPLNDADIQKKKKRKRSGEDVEQLQSGAVAEPLNDADIQKKKKRKRSGEDVEQLQSGALAEPLNDADIQKKKKKRKKELGIVIPEEHEEEEASNMTLDLPLVSTGQVETSGNCSENAAASQDTLGSSFVKRKKHKKKQQSLNNEAPQDGGEGADVSFSLEDSLTLAKGSGTSKKKKKKRRKSLFEGMNFSSYTPEEEGNQKTNEGLEEQNPEPVMKKKKKKKSGIFSRGVCEDKVAQSNDSVSAREKEKKRKSSFLVADAEENDVEELNDGVTKRKKKRKRKMSAEQESVEEGHEWDCEEPDKTRRGALPQSADTGRKMKKKRTGSESGRLDGAADAAFSPHDEAAVLKKKKKKCNDVMKEGPPTATTCSSVSRKGKGKRCDSANVSQDGSTHDQASTGTLTSVECDLASSNDAGHKKKKKKKKLKNEEKSSTESAELEPIENIKKQKKRNKQSTTPETSDVKNKHRKRKRKLHNPNEDFLTDC
ncbi:hypothetical protein VZT92_006015 [Zoarces viviparus]|uniref:Uncharacterized protein n=1 Tax=Zoarces viviparus TaxID=48416 RepID=A0AAW1FNG0_ZOAVI